MNMRNLICGVAMLIAGAVGIYCLFTKECKSYLVIGTLLFIFAGIGFLKRVKD